MPVMLKSEIDAEVSRRMRKWASKGGSNTAKKLRAGKTREQVSEIMRALANKRYAKAREAAKLREAS